MAANGYRRLEVEKLRSETETLAMRLTIRIGRIATGCLAALAAVIKL